MTGFSALPPDLRSVVVFPDGSVTWAAPHAEAPNAEDRVQDCSDAIAVECEVVACEVVPEFPPLPLELARSPRPHQPEWMMMNLPEFAGVR